MKRWVSWILGSSVKLFQCADCGLRYYDPRFAGSAEFYETLMSSAPYAQGRPEFNYAIEFAREQKLSRVLDVGAGEGAFLDAARRSGLETFGLELNRNAAKLLEQKGHRVITQQLEEIDLTALEGGAQLLTLFQVVEHVPAPAAFVAEAARLVVPGGFMIVSVPNEHRALGLHPLDPSNWPPHHISRWRRKNLEWLARNTGLRLLQIQGEPLVASLIQQFWLAHNHHATAIGRKPHWGGVWLPGLVAGLYRWTGCKHVFPKMGLSLYAVHAKELNAREPITLHFCDQNGYGCAMRMM